MSSRTGRRLSGFAAKRQGRSRKDATRRERGYNNSMAYRITSPPTASPVEIQSISAAGPMQVLPASAARRDVKQSP